MTKRFACNIIGYIDDTTDKYNSKQVSDMLDRKSIKECFPPINVLQIVIQDVNNITDYRSEIVDTPKRIRRKLK
jgi:hypothetical protein